MDTRDRGRMRRGRWLAWRGGRGVCRDGLRGRDQRGKGEMGAGGFMMDRRVR